MPEQACRAGDTASWIGSRYLAEPALLFADNGWSVDPKAGIATFGPESLGDPRHPGRVRVGFIGSAETVEATREWLSSCASGFQESEGESPFPGFRADRGFFSDLAFSSDWDEQITQSELRDVTRLRNPQERFEAAAALLSEKMRRVSERDQTPDVVVAALPDSLVRRTRVADYQDAERGWVHRDFRRAFKASAMGTSLPTQVLLSRTVRGGVGVDLPERCAWNFFTALYFKAGGIPWKPIGLAPETCFVGISFFRPLGSRANTLRTSIAMAFDESGEGIVLRGQEFPWSGDDGPSPHLSSEQAGKLLGMTLDRYKAERKHTPRRVVVHKSSTFWPDERRGFEEALAGAAGSYDLLAFTPSSEIRLLRQGRYPPLRGTWFRLGDLDFLYTTGYIAHLRAFTHGHVPSPLRIMDHVGGDTSRAHLLQEVLILTKMNWNSANLGGLWPITLRFSRLVGDIMREMGPDEEPKPQFKFYV